ncbi:MAG: TonB-dependent receptor [Porticoccaceae bacterium]
MQKTISKLTIAVAISGAAAATTAATLDEIVVTAQKRAQSLQDVPVSVAAVDAEKISDAGIVDLQGLSEFVPNFTINETGISTTITVRGISSGINSGFEQSVGMYNDGVFYGRDQLARVPMLDMERVEVLRGPQGILFGKNSIAGAVSQVTAKPTDDFEGSITGLYEPDHGEQDLRVVLSGPLSENVSGRIAILDRSLDGYMTNTLLKQDEQQEDERLIRASLRWDINEDITANFKTSRATFDTVGRNLEVFNSVKLPGEESKDHLTVLNSLVGGFVRGEDGQIVYDDGKPIVNPEKYIEGKLNRSGSMNPSSSDNVVNNNTLSVDWQLDGLTFTSVTGFVDYEFDELCDCDFTGAEVFNATRDEKYSQFSQEFRFASELGNTVDYIGGLFYQKNDLDYQDAIKLTDPTVITEVLQTTASNYGDKAAEYGAASLAAEAAAKTAAAAGNMTAAADYADKAQKAGEAYVGYLAKSEALKRLVIPAAPGASTKREFDQDGDVFAIFAQATWNIADDLRLTVGGRYTKESKDASRSQQHFTKDGKGLPAKTSDPDKSPLANGAAGVPTYLDGWDDTNIHNALFGAFAVEPYDKIPGDLDDESFTPLVSGQWDINEDVMLYATWTQGYKSGGFDARSNAHPNKDVKNAQQTDKVNWLQSNELKGTWEFNPEEVNSFELGSKMVIAEGAAELNLAFYSMDYSDLQVSQFDGTLGFNVTNAGEATVKGLEADGRWAVSDNVTLTGSAAYLDFNYDKFPDSQCYFGQDDPDGDKLCDAAGKRKEYTPEFQANIGALWSGQVMDSFYLDASMDIAYMDEYFYAATLDPRAKQDAYTMVNARVSLANAGDTWEVALIGRNLTDKTVVNFGGNTPLASTLTGGTGNSYYGFVNRPRNFALQGTYRF